MKYLISNPKHLHDFIRYNKSRTYRSNNHSRTYIVETEDGWCVGFCKSVCDDYHIDITSPKDLTATNTVKNIEIGEETYNLVRDIHQESMAKINNELTILREFEVKLGAGHGCRITSDPLDKKKEEIIELITLTQKEAGKTHVTAPLDELEDFQFQEMLLWLNANGYTLEVSPTLKVVTITWKN